MITHLVYPPKLCIAIDSNYSLALQWSQKKSKTIQMQNLDKEHYDLRENGEFEQFSPLKVLTRREYHVI